MKTVTALSNVQIVRDNQVIFESPINNPCQMWRDRNGWFEKFGDDIEAIVFDVNGNEYMHFKAEVTKNGHRIIRNAVVATRRAQVMKAKKAAAIARAKKDAKNAKARARYAAKKALKTQEATVPATENTEVAEG